VLGIRRAISTVASSKLGFGAFTMNGTPIHGPWNSPAGQKALAVFHQQLGKAVAAWSTIEDGLFEWFKHCTGLEERLARSVFYSARSFEGRRDMLSAAIPFSSCDEKTRTGIRLCIKRARQYSEFRNRISHGHIIYTYIGVAPQHVITEGRALSGAPNTSYVTLEDLKAATINFDGLAYCLLGFHPEWQAPDVCALGCLEEIQALPIAANSKQPFPIPPQTKQPPTDPVE
jgi:hypothetical protein